MNEFIKSFTSFQKSTDINYSMRVYLDVKGTKVT